MTATEQTIADMIRTAPLGNATREATARHFAKSLGLSPTDAERFIQRCMGWSPEINNI